MNEYMCSCCDYLFDELRSRIKNVDMTKIYETYLG